MMISDAEAGGPWAHFRECYMTVWHRPFALQGVACSPPRFAILVLSLKRVRL